jgi:hypothetical protein
LPESVDHGNFVNQWLQQSASGLSSNQLLHLFETAMGILYQRAYLTLGDVTLTAVVDRVVYNAGEKFPMFELLDSDPSGVNCNGLREHAKSGNEVELTEGIRFVLVEFLTVIGNLTAEILTPALHSELSRVVLENGPSDGTVSREGK